VLNDGLEDGGGIVLFLPYSLPGPVHSIRDDDAHGEEVVGGAETAGGEVALGGGVKLGFLRGRSGRKRLGRCGAGEGYFVLDWLVAADWGQVLCHCWCGLREGMDCLGRLRLRAMIWLHGCG